MFLSFSKVLAKMGGFRLGLGIRITKKNAAYMYIILMMVYLLQATWYLLILCFWLMYAVCYGLWWCIRKIFKR